MSFASNPEQGRPPRVRRSMWSGLVAALGCGVLGGCIVTSEATFPEEEQVPPVILNTPELPIGSVIGYDSSRSTQPEVRLGISVSDENIEDTLEVHTELSVVGQPTVERVCTMAIQPSGRAERERIEILIPKSQIRVGACNQVTVFVSREFVGTCLDPVGFGKPQLGRTDIATAQFQIWETSDSPQLNEKAALQITSTCPIMMRATTTSMPMGQ